MRPIVFVVFFYLLLCWVYVNVCVCVCAGLQPTHIWALWLLQSLSAARNTKKMDPKSQSYSYCKADLNDELNKLSGFVFLHIEVRNHSTCVHVVYEYVCWCLYFQSYAPVMVGTPRAENQQAYRPTARSSPSHNSATEVIQHYTQVVSNCMSNTKIFF